MKTTIPAWYGIYRREYVGKEPAFFDAEQFDWAKTLTNNFEIIRNELQPLMHEDNSDLVPYFDDNIQFPPKNWKTIGFGFWGTKDRRIRARFPKTTAILNQIPNLVSASFNLLEPHSHINPHFGDTDAVFRVHLGIQIPASLPECGFTVKGESRAWENGKLLVFLDANVHEAFNHSSGKRYILLMDILRPEFADRKIAVCSKVLAMLSLYRVIYWFPVLADIKSPDWVIDILLVPFRLLWWAYLLVRG